MIPSEAPTEEVRDMLTTSFRFDYYSLMLRSVKEGSLGPNIPSNGMHYYCGMLSKTGFFTIGADDYGRMIYYPTDKARNLIKMVSEPSAFAQVV